MTTKARRRRSRLGLLIVSMLLLAGATARFERFLFRNNNGVVEAGRLYRSGQPGRELAQTVTEHKIASILNLRGGSWKDWWYTNEATASQRLGVAFYDFPMAADKAPTRDQILQLIDLFDRCDYPLLVHCKSGSDRTGLAVALYRLMVRGEDPLEAERAFSLDYAHIPLFGPERLHEPFRLYSAWLNEHALTHDPSRFRHFIETAYYPDGMLSPQSGPPTPITSGPRMKLVRSDQPVTSR